MLKEKNSFYGNLPVNLLVAEIEEYPIHFHDALEIIFVLEGKISLRNGYYNYVLKEKDIFVLNSREIHSLNQIDREKNMVMMFQINVDYFSSYYKGLRNSFFVTDSDHGDDESLDILQDMLGKIMVDFLRKGYRYEQKILENTHNIIGILRSDFQYFLMDDGKFVNEKQKKGNKILAGRLSRITDYMYENYGRKLTLNEIAEQEHLSIYYLSHVIKESTGLSFQDLLSFIRVEESEKLILGTRKKVGAIAAETGFSAVRYYVKHFKRWYGIHPLEYRKKYAGKVLERSSSAKIKRTRPEDIEEILRKEMGTLLSDADFSTDHSPLIVDLCNTEDRNKIKEVSDLEVLFHNNLLHPINSPYRMLKRLREETICCGEHYIVTGNRGEDNDFRQLSILIYNFDEQSIKQLGRAQRMQEVYDLVKKSKQQRELLLRLGGVRGEYEIYRYRLPKENCLYAFKKFMEKKPKVDFRKEIIERWLGLPQVEVDRVTISDALTLQVSLKGISAELILMEKQ